MGEDRDVSLGRTVVLVHGAWHGGWSWERVVPELHARGLGTLVIDLPGPGRAAGRCDLAGHAAALASTVDALDGEVVLCGHSYGGAVISEAATSLPSVVGLVYVAAFLLTEGESCRDANPPDPAATGPDPVRIEDGYLHFDQQAALVDFYGDCAEPDARAAARRLTPEHAGTVTAPQTRAAWRTVPSAYVVTGRDRALPAAAQRRMAARAGRMIEFDSAHSPMLSAPGQLAAAIAHLVFGMSREG